MKKILWIAPVVALLAAGCNTTQSTTQDQPEKNAQQTNTTPQTYTSSKFGFSVQYPSGWTVTDGAGTQDGVTISDAAHVNNPLLTIAYSNSLTEASMGAPLTKRASLQQAVSYDLPDAKPVTISGAPGFKGTFTNKAIGYTGTQIYLIQKGHIYLISYDKSLEGDAQINQIISSLTFTK